MTQYRMGICEICKKFKALKDNICFECRKKHLIDMPDCFKNLFGRFQKREEK